MFIYLQSLHEENLSNRLLQDQEAWQELLVQSITQNIGSDLDGALHRLKALSQTLRLSVPVGYDLQNITQTVCSDIMTIVPFDEIFIVDKDGTGLRMVGGPVVNTTESFAVTSFNIANGDKVLRFYSKFVSRKKNFNSHRDLTWTPFVALHCVILHSARISMRK